MTQNDILAAYAVVGIKLGALTPGPSLAWPAYNPDVSVIFPQIIDATILATQPTAQVGSLDDPNGIVAYWQNKSGATALDIWTAMSMNPYYQNPNVPNPFPQLLNLSAASISALMFDPSYITTSLSPMADELNVFFGADWSVQVALTVVPLPQPMALTSHTVDSNGNTDSWLAPDASGNFPENYWSWTYDSAQHAFVYGTLTVSAESLFPGISAINWQQLGVDETIYMHWALMIIAGQSQHASSFMSISSVAAGMQASGLFVNGFASFATPQMILYLYNQFLISYQQYIQMQVQRDLQGGMPTIVKVAILAMIVAAVIYSGGTGLNLFSSQESGLGLTPSGASGGATLSDITSVAQTFPVTATPSLADLSATDLSPWTGAIGTAASTTTMVGSVASTAGTVASTAGSFLPTTATGIIGAIGAGAGVIKGVIGATKSPTLPVSTIAPSTGLFGSLTSSSIMPILLIGGIGIAALSLGHHQGKVKK